MGPVRRLWVLGMLVGCASHAADRPDRYDAVRARIREQERRCQNESRVVLERRPVPPGSRPVVLSDYEWCLERGADWIVLPELGSLRPAVFVKPDVREPPGDRKSTRLNSSHLGISYAVFCLKKKNT